MVDTAATLTNLSGYVEIVRDRAWQRQLIDLCQTTIEDSYAGRKTGSALARRLAEQLPTLENRSGSRWSGTQSAPDFIAHVETEPEWLYYPLLSRGAITEFFSPRGTGKTHVAHALAVLLAQRGLRALLLDRDNGRGELRRRLRKWGVTDNLTTLQVGTRDQVPPLTDRRAWGDFPTHNFDLVIIDSLDATTEGVGEQDSARPSRAIAPLLDIAHQANGPAVLVLGNTIKSAKHGRGSGVIEDRADICFEVRDATGFIPTGTRDWWQELPKAGTGTWAERATRRTGQTRHRLAFVASKFRVGQEPTPFILEVDLAGEQWTLRDVTPEVVETGREVEALGPYERAAKLDAAATTLLHHAQVATERGLPLCADRDAVPVLMKSGLTRAEARQLIREQDGVLWELKTQAGQRGRPKILRPLLAATRPSVPPAAETPSPSKPDLVRPSDGLPSAELMNSRRRECGAPDPAPEAGPQRSTFFPPATYEPAHPRLEEVDL